MKKLFLALVFVCCFVGTVFCGDTGLGTSPFSAGGNFTSANANALNDEINDNNTRIVVNEGYWTTIRAIVGPIFGVGDGTYTDLSALSSTELLLLNGKTSIQEQPSEGPFVDGDKTKLDTIENSADVTDATNVAAAGALMVSNLEGSPTEDEDEKAPTSEWAYDLETKVDNGLSGTFDLSDGGWKLVDYLTLTAGEKIAVTVGTDKGGIAVYSKYDGSNGLRIYMVNANSTESDLDTYYQIGIAPNVIASAASGIVFTGRCMLMRRDEFSFTSADLGKPMWALDSGDGNQGTTKPSDAGDHLIKVGIVVGVDGVGGITGDYILYDLQKISVKVAS